MMGVYLKLMLIQLKLNISGRYSSLTAEKTGRHEGNLTHRLQQMPQGGSNVTLGGNISLAMSLTCSTANLQNKRASVYVHVASRLAF